MAPKFAELLKAYREEVGLSQRALARLTEINPAIISRMESEDRGPSGPEQVLAIVQALKLDARRADLLLGAGGFWPRTILALGPTDETLLAVARVLTDPHVDAKSRQRLRGVIELLVQQWLGDDGGRD